MQCFLETNVELELLTDEVSREGDDGANPFEAQHSSNHVVSNIASLDLGELFTTDLDKILEAELKGSNLTFQYFKQIDVVFYHTKPVRGSGYVQLPDRISNKKAVINVNNDKDVAWEDRCFELAVMSYEFKFAKNADRLSKYKKVQSNYDFSGLEFPVNKFVKQNDVSGKKTKKVAIKGKSRFFSL